MGIIAGAIGVSSNGRTRDFGSLYHGSNPCAPTKNQTGLVPVLFLVRDHGTTPATQLPVRQQVDLISRAQSNRYGCPAGVAHLCVTPREPVRSNQIGKSFLMFTRKYINNVLYVFRSETVVKILQIHKNYLQTAYKMLI